MFWVLATISAGCLFLGLFLLLDPTTRKDPEEEPQEKTARQILLAGYRYEKPRRRRQPPQRKPAHRAAVETFRL